MQYCGIPNTTLKLITHELFRQRNLYESCVYIFTTPEKFEQSVYKIGMTGNLHTRYGGYKTHTSEWTTDVSIPYPCPSEEEARKLEAAIKEAIAGYTLDGDPRFGPSDWRRDNEWFQVPLFHIKAEANRLWYQRFGPDSTSPSQPTPLLPPPRKQKVPRITYKPKKYGIENDSAFTSDDEADNEEKEVLRNFRDTIQSFAYQPIGDNDDG